MFHIKAETLTGVSVHFSIFIATHPFSTLPREHSPEIVDLNNLIVILGCCIGTREKQQCF
jgi:hypothetical protein